MEHNLLCQAFGSLVLWCWRLFLVDLVIGRLGLGNFSAAGEGIFCVERRSTQIPPVRPSLPGHLHKTMEDQQPRGDGPASCCSKLLGGPLCFWIEDVAGGWRASRWSLGLCEWATGEAEIVFLLLKRVDFSFWISMVVYAVSHFVWWTL